MTARWLHRAVLCTAVAGLVAATGMTGAYAGTHRLEAESGTIVDTGCGDETSAEISGGTGTVSFLAGDGCEISFGSADGRQVDAINFFITGQAATMCGYFTASGSRTGTSSTLCVDGTNASATYGTVAFHTTGTGTGSFTVEWHVSTGASWVNAYVDYLTYAGVEAESGTIVNVNCGDGGDATGMQAENDGSRRVVFYPGDGCTQTFTKPAGSVLPASITFKVTGSSGTICGHFAFSGAYTGTSTSVCGGTYATATVAAVAGLGSTFTIEWVTDVGTPTLCNAYVDYLTFA